VVHNSLPPITPGWGASRGAPGARPNQQPARWRPHITICYSTSRQPAKPIIDALGTRLPGKTRHTKGFDAPLPRPRRHAERIAGPPPCWSAPARPAYDGSAASPENSCPSAAWEWPRARCQRGRELRVVVGLPVGEPQRHRRAVDVDQGVDLAAPSVASGPARGLRAQRPDSCDSTLPGRLYGRLATGGGRRGKQLLPPGGFWHPGGRPEQRRERACQTLMTLRDRPSCRTNR